MNRKLQISIGFLLSIFIISAYFLWQIDRHEKALLDKVFLIQLTKQQINIINQKEKDYWSSLNNYKVNNSQVMEKVDKYRSLRDPNYLPGSSFKKLNNFNIMLPVDLQMTDEGREKFMAEYPSEGKIYSAICNDMRDRFKDGFPDTRGKNPPKPQIEQSIKTFYRIMFAIDVILILGLVIFLFLYNNPSKKETSF